MQEEARGHGVLAPQGLDAVARRSRPICAAACDAAGYLEVRTPQVLDRVFWEKSGHWEKFASRTCSSRETEDGERARRSSR